MNRGRPSKCPYCDSTQTRPKGYRKTASLGLRKLRICKSCSRRFTVSSKARPTPLAGNSKDSARPHASDNADMADNADTAEYK